MPRDRKWEYRGRRQLSPTAEDGTGRRRSENTGDDRSTGRRRSENTGDDRGTGLFGMIMGFTVFLLLLVAAVQILFNLYATTVVTSAAADAARVVAGYDSASDRCAATADAESAFWQALGDYSQRGSATLTWVCDDSETVSLGVVADHPTILPQQLRGLMSLGRLNRVIEVRVEDMR